MYFLRFIKFFIIGISLSGISMKSSAQSDSAISDTSANVEIELSVGDTLTLGDCKNTYYNHINYFKKTRFPEFIPYDTATGQGFYASFFATGDFDAKKLSCSYAGKKFAILGIESLMDKKTKENFTVVYLKGDEAHSVLWVEIEPASNSLEILFDEKTKTNK